MDWTDRIGRRLKPRDLHVFLTVVQSGSMAKAAEFLSCSRPVVSKSIAELESTLGVPLLDRTPRGVEPTRYGRALLQRGIAVFDDLKQCVEEIAFLADPGTGELSFGCTDTLMTGIASAATLTLVERYPKMVFRPQLGSLHAQVEFLRSRLCEVVLIRVSPALTGSDLLVEDLFFERLLLVAGARSKWRNRKTVNLSELIDETWILSPQEAEPGSPVYEGFLKAGLKIPRRYYTCQTHSDRLYYGQIGAIRHVPTITRTSPRRSRSLRVGRNPRMA